MNHEIDNKKQKARLALIMKTSKLRLWFYDPTTRHCCYLSEAACDGLRHLRRQDGYWQGESTE